MDILQRFLRRVLRRPGNILNVPSASGKDQLTMIFYFFFAPLIIWDLRMVIFPEFDFNPFLAIPFIGATGLMMKNGRTLAVTRSYVKKELKKKYYAPLFRTLFSMLVGIYIFWHLLFGPAYELLAPLERKIYGFSIIYFIISHVYRHIIEFSNFLSEMYLKDSLQLLQTYAYLRYFFFSILIYLFIIPILLESAFFPLVFGLFYGFFLAPLVPYAMQNKNVEFSIKILKAVAKGNDTIPKIQKSTKIKDGEILEYLLGRLVSSSVIVKRNGEYSPGVIGS